MIGKQFELDGMEVPALLGLRRFMRKRSRMRVRRPTKAQRRNEASRRDPRQSSIFGAQHTVELTAMLERSGK